MNKDRKITLLLDHAGRSGQEVAEPWYTGDFEAACNDIPAYCEGFWPGSQRQTSNKRRKHVWNAQL